MTWDGHDRRNEAEAELHAEKAADRAVRNVFAILGVDIDRPESIEEFREDLRFGKRMRKAADHGWLVFVGLVAMAVGAVMWAGILARLGGGK